MKIQRTPGKARSTVRANAEVAPEVSELLFEADDVAMLLAEVTGEDVVVSDAEGEDMVAFEIAGEEFIVEAEGDEEVLEASVRPAVTKRTVAASSRRSGRTSATAGKSVRRIAPAGRK